MPLDSLDNAYKSAFAVSGKTHLFGMPTIYKWGTVQTEKRLGRRLFQKHDKYVVGGMHMTNPAYLPMAILKELIAT